MTMKNERVQERLVQIYRRYRTEIDEAAASTGLPPELIAAVIYHESGGNARAMSRTGARGLMQLMPRTARGFGVTDPFDPRQNIMAGARYLRGQLDRFGGNLALALAAYNAGPRNVYKYDRDIPPFRETQNYVRSIGALLQAYAPHVLQQYTFEAPSLKMSFSNGQSSVAGRLMERALQPQKQPSRPKRAPLWDLLQIFQPPQVAPTTQRILQTTAQHIPHDPVDQLAFLLPLPGAARTTLPED
jgi:hypothetical protein